MKLNFIQRGKKSMCRIFSRSTENTTSNQGEKIFIKISWRGKTFVLLRPMVCVVISGEKKEKKKEKTIVEIEN